MAVKLLKLTTGEEVVADIEAHENGYNLKYPVRIVATREGLGMVPWSPFLKEQKVRIPVEHVLFSAELDPEIESGYNEKFGNGIVIASSLSDLTR
jgi:hypothetical protein